MATAEVLSVGKSDKRQAILDAALGLFAERGFHGTAVPAIAKAAEVGAGTVYRYFDSKEGIVNALYQHYKQQLASFLIARVRLDQPAREQFHAYWQGMAEFARNYSDAYKFLELHHHAEYLDDESRALEQRLTGMARKSFEVFQAQQVVKDVDPYILMAVVHGSFVGLVRTCSGQKLLMSQAAVDATEQCVWEAIRR